jgi:two-component system, NarL family, invasion response regulator UvrY
MKILIVDDHPVVRAGLKRLFTGHDEFQFAEAAEGKEALVLCRSYRPDLVIVDLNLPDSSGFELIGRLLREEPPPRVLVLSMHDDPIFALRALEAGASGYISKNAPPVQILEAIDRIGKGERYIGPELAQEMAFLHLHAPIHPLKDLSRRDLEILRRLGEGQGLKEIADALGLGYKTVANNCTQMKAKLGVTRTAGLIRIALQNGLVIGD